MAYTKKQAAAMPGLQRIKDKKKSGGGLTRLDKPGKPTKTTRPAPGRGGPKPKPVKKAR